MWRTLVLVPAIALLSLLAHAPGAVEAKDGGSITVAPDAGDDGSTIQLAGEFWPPNADVAIYAGYSPVLWQDEGGVVARAEPAGWLGPIARVRSEPWDTNPAYGRWHATIDLDDIEGLPEPAGPGFVLFKAVTEGSAVSGAVQVEGREEVADFALTVDGRRPDGAGGINLTVSVASGLTDESFLYGIVPEGEAFYYAYAGAMLTNYMKPWQTSATRFADGDYWVFVQPITGREVIGAGAFERVETQFCFAPPLGCNPRGTFTVKRVAVREGEMANVEIVLGRPDEAPALEIAAPPAAGAGPAGGSNALWPAAAGTAVLGFVLVLAGLLRRRAS